MASPVINTRADLDSIAGTKQHDEFMELLKGSMTRKEDVADYPDNYHEPDYDGPKVEPVWHDVEDLSLIHRFGFTKADFE